MHSNSTLRTTANYTAIGGIAFGRERSAAKPVDESTPLPAKVRPDQVSFRSGTVNFSPGAITGDIAALIPQNYGRTVFLDSVTISGSANSPVTIDLLIQRSPNGGGLPQSHPYAALDQRHRSPTAAFGTFSAERTVNGHGIDASRPLLSVHKLHLSSGDSAPHQHCITFSDHARPSLKSLDEWIVVNLGGLPAPAGCDLNITIQWSEQAQPLLQFAGDSTTSHALSLFEALSNSGRLGNYCNFFNAGSNGYRLEDYLLHTNGIPYPQGWNGVLDRLNGQPGVLVLGYGLNDLRQGQRSKADLISMIDAALHATRYGTVAGETYLSPVGSNLDFTWPAQTVPNPDTRIILWAPNMVATDGNEAGGVELSGRFSSMTTTQAAQTMTDDVREAYSAFADDERVFRLVQKQDVFGKTAISVSESGLMADNLHPNSRGQILLARQIHPHLLDALAAARADIL